MNLSALQLHWPLILGMAALALVSPVMSVSGLLGRPFNPTFLNLVIAVIWLAIVVLVNLRRPFVTLVVTGLVHGIFVIILSGVLSQMILGELAGPLTNIYGFFGVLVINIIWGAFLGGIAWGIQRMRSKAHHA